jgi:hypothetical protein
VTLHEVKERHYVPCIFILHIYIHAITFLDYHASVASEVREETFVQ